MRVSCRRSDRAQGASSVHDHHGEGGAERAGLPEGVFISGHSDLHHGEVPVGRCGETETVASQSSEKGNREWRVGATRQLQSRHGRNGEVPGNVSEFRLSVLSVGFIQLELLFLSRFKLAPKLKEPKPKSENVDPNKQKESKKKDDEAKKPPKAGLLMRGNHQPANSLFMD